MQIIFIKLNVTKHWADSIKQAAGELYGVYAYDPEKHVHCCELTPSYELTYVDTATDEHVSDDIFYEILQWQGLGEVCYFHVSDIDKIPESNKKPMEFHSIEDAEEYAKGNAIF